MKISRRSALSTLKMLDGSMIEIFHMNDYSGSISREKVLSLELFNRSYWEKDPLEVAKTGLEKMKTLVGQIS